MLHMHARQIINKASRGQTTSLKLSGNLSTLSPVMQLELGGAFAGFATPQKAKEQV